MVNAKEATKMVERFRASKSFAVEKAQVMADFQKSDEFYALCRDFS